MNSGVLFATLSPIFWGLADVFNKYIISHKIRNGMSYLVLWGGVQLAAGFLLACVLDWSGVTMTALLFPIFSGLLYGIESFLYIEILKTEEASHVLGFIYLYPAVTALLSWIFLNEVHGAITYAGMLLIVAGVTVLSVKLSRRRVNRNIFAFLLIGTLIGVHCFLIKMATMSLTVPQGISVDIMTLGVTMMLPLFSASVRRTAARDIRHLPWVLLANIELLGLVCGYLAMARLPATIVSSIGVLQIMVVIVCEHLLRRKEARDGIRIAGERKGEWAERRLRPKLMPLSIIMIGVSMISSQEFYSMLLFR